MLSLKSNRGDEMVTARDLAGRPSFLESQQVYMSEGKIENEICECGNEKGWDDESCPQCQEEAIMKKEEEGKLVLQEDTPVSIMPGNAPAALIQSAIQGGADLDKLEKLLTLQERWEANEARKAYHMAMAAFKANPPKIGKDKLVSFKTDRGTTSYHHASLANVCEKISTELSKHGLSASWTTKQNGAVSVTCRITHVKGHGEETTLTAKEDTSGSKNSIQAIGSTITYLERYTLLALTGLATYDMDDGMASEIVEYITDEQKHAIVDNLLAIDDKVEPLLKFLKVESLDMIPKGDYKKVLTVIEARKKAKAK